MDRVLEPEVMDSECDALDYSRMDHRAVNSLFVDEFLHFLSSNGLRLRQSIDPSFDDLGDGEANVIASLVDFGTGTAQIPVELCQRNSDVRVMAIDMASHMLDLAIRNVDVAGLREQIQLAQIDAKDTGLEDDMFDGLISNSIIHHIPQPQTVIEEMIRVTRQDGVIFVRDLLRPESDVELEKLLEIYVSDESNYDYSRRLFGKSLRASLSLEEVRDIVSSVGFCPDDVSRTSDRHWTWATVL